MSPSGIEQGLGGASPDMASLGRERRQAEAEQAAVVYHYEIKTWDANQYQPDCCLSLTMAWLFAMRDGEAAAIVWCNQAKEAGESGSFYVEHVQNTRQLNREARIEALQVDSKSRAARVKAADERRARFMESLEKAQEDGSDTTPLLAELGQLKQEALSLKSELTSGSAEIDDLLGEGEIDRFLLMNQMRVEWRRSDDCDRQLAREIAALDGEKRYYLLSLRAKTRSHVVGLVSTKEAGCFSPNGYLYYYDSNLKRMVRFRSRRDLATFWQTTGVDYQGLWRVVKLASTA